MHELTICIHLIKLIEAEAKNQLVKKIWIEVGELAGIDCEALQFSFPIAAKNSIANAAVIEIISIQGSAYCSVCRNNYVMHSLFDFCKHCGTYSSEIKQGKELRVTKIEVA